MTILQAAILGVVEGITEFLPISSTGHLILVGRLLGVDATSAVRSFNIAVQLGAIGAATLLYGRTLLRSRRTCLLVLTAFLPTAVIGFLAHAFVKQFLLGSTAVVLWSLFLGGLFLIGFEYAIDRTKEVASRKIETMTLRQALVIGCAQALAIIPGVSRSAATIVGGMLLGIPRRTIVEFSFMLAIPTMTGATALDLMKSASQMSSNDLGLIAIGFGTAFGTALIAMRWLLRYVQQHSFVGFGIYRVILGGVMLLILTR